MKNIPSILHESESARLVREQAERNKEIKENNEVLNDYLNAFDGFNRNTIFTQQDLLFLYNFGGNPIEAIAQDANATNQSHRAQLFNLASQVRDHSADLAIMLGCRRDQIANTPSEITADTKAYIGDLIQKDKHTNIIPIFSLFPSSVEHIYTKFPEQKIRKEKLEIGGKTVEQLRSDLATGNFQLYDNGLLDSEDLRQSIYLPPSFTTLKPKETIPLIRLTFAQLGFPKGATTKEIFDRAAALGLEFCPPEVGPYYRIQYTNQPRNEYIRVGMKPILDRDLNPRVFNVHRLVADSWLNDSWAYPGYRWDADDQLLFRLRKSDF